MRRVGALSLLAAAAVGLAGAALAGGAQTRIGVRASEWELLLSRPAVSPGDAEIQYQNQGEDPHDLRIRRRSSSRVHPIAELEPGGLAELGLRLRRNSRYVMWCSTQDGLHRELGMEAELRVRKR